MTILTAVIQEALPGGGGGGGVHVARLNKLMLVADC